MRKIIFAVALLVGCSDTFPEPMKRGNCRAVAYRGNTAVAYQCAYKDADWLCEGEKVFATYSFSCRRTILEASL